jgi:hypothetical protein
MQVKKSNDAAKKVVFVSVGHMRGIISTDLEG